MKSHTPEVLIYTRGISSNDVNEHLENCLAFTEKILGYTWIDDRHRRKAVTATHDPGTDSTVLVHRRRSDNTGIRIERDWSRQKQQTGRRRALDLLDEYGSQLDLVVPTVESIGRNRKHVDELMEILGNGITVHIVRSGVTLHAPTNAARELLEIRTGLYTNHERVEPSAPDPVNEDVELEFAAPDAPVEADVAAVTAPTSESAGSPVDVDTANEPAVEITPDTDTCDFGSGKFEFPVRRKYTTGRPPKGFDVVDEGAAIESNDHYRTIHTVVQSYRDGELSQSKAADKLDCSRATIDNLAERTELYQLA
ncbi:hypothetical protein [Halorubrum sp. DTA98]|uniref:hypothetical protein n=1 Tax=Halorubrum sp. DTA98 TaxID=3402163 RepID=UPI003AAD1FDC